MPGTHRGQLLGHQVAHRREHLQGAQRLLLVHPADGEPDVDDDVVAQLDVRLVGQAGLLADAAEVDAAHAQAVLVVDLDDLARDAQTHVASPPARLARPGEPSRAAPMAACP